MISNNTSLSISPVTTIKSNILESKLQEGEILNDQLLTDAKKII